MMKDLSLDTDYVRCVDYATMASAFADPNDSALQITSDHLSFKCNESGMILNIQKTKEMLIHFGRKISKEFIPQLLIHSKEIE
jgi:hypothetical protein